MEDSYVLELTEPKFKDFHLVYCGYAQCEACHSYGPATRPNYIIHYILEGKGVYQVGERKYQLSAGQGFLIEPDTLTFYQADPEEPWSYLWVGVGGEEAGKYIRDIGLNGNQLIFQYEDGERLKRIVLDMLRHTKVTMANLYYLQGRLYDFFSALTEDEVIDSCVDISKESIYIQKAVTFIRNNYSRGLNVADIAVHMNVNRSYLYTLFKNNLGMSPKDFLTKFQISQAREQLNLTELSIEEVAEACGYRSCLVFSKAFKKENGMTPTEYRKRRRLETKHRPSAGPEEWKGIGRKVRFTIEEENEVTDKWENM